MTDKPFSELSEDEATELAKSCVKGAKSESEIRERLERAGFNSTAASIDSVNDGYFMALILVWGPNGEVIGFSLRK